MICSRCALPLKCPKCGEFPKLWTRYANDLVTLCSCGAELTHKCKTAEVKAKGGGKGATGTASPPEHP